MNRDTVLKFNAMCQKMETFYNAGNVRNFTAGIPEAITLMKQIQDTDAFSKLITILPVTDIVGKPITMTIGSTIASRTDTTGDGKRTPKKIFDLNQVEYRCEQTNFDIAIPYNDMDAYARFPNFEQLIMQLRNTRICLDRILIGWYGETAEKTTDKDGNAKLEDLNIGWPALLKKHNLSHYMTEVVKASGKIRIGEGGDYKNLDHMVYDVGSIIPKKNRTGKEIAIIGEELIARDTGKILENNGSTPSERILFKTLEKSYGNYPSITIPEFPSRGLFVGDPKHLHLYFQDRKVRRQVRDNPEKNQVEDFMSSNEAYMIGDFEAVAMLEAENVVFTEDETQGA